MNITFDTGEEVLLEHNGAQNKYRVKYITGYSDDLMDCLVLHDEESGEQIVVKKFYQLQSVDEEGLNLRA